MVSFKKPSEIFLENLELKLKNDHLQRIDERQERHPSLFQNEEQPEKKPEKKLPNMKQTTQHRSKIVLKFLLLCPFIIGAITIFAVILINQERILKTIDSDDRPETKTRYELLHQIASEETFQDCKSSQLKQSFPDLDYALLGYNILKGFPLAVGHDPGFTYPIFKADYSAGKQTADCRYSVPNGLVVIPDVSCITSFSSAVVQTKYEFSRSLSAYASVSGQAWGARFSASGGYKRSSTEISTGESVFILSTANCNYYFSKLKPEMAPQFDDAFIRWVHRLDNSKFNMEMYFKFFETYGTHFAKDVTFGARYTFEHKMKSEYYEKERTNSVDVKVAASYSSFLHNVNVEGGLHTSQKDKLAQFRENVETKTISVGAAPPENGSELSWASVVKSSPVPTSYKLLSIEELFTDTFMASISIDYKQIYNKIKKYKMEYCLYLQKKGEVESCDDLVAGTELRNTRILGHYKERAVSSVSDCIEVCLQEIQCEAVSFCTTCSKRDNHYKTCYFIKNKGKRLAVSKSDNPNAVWQSNVFPGKIRSQLHISRTSINGVPRGVENEEDKTADLQRCKELCIEDAHCSAYSYTHSDDKVTRCQMYSTDLINSLQTEDNTGTFFISARTDIKTTTASTTLPNDSTFIQIG